MSDELRKALADNDLTRENYNIIRKAALTYLAEHPAERATMTDDELIAWSTTIFPREIEFQKFQKPPASDWMRKNNNGCWVYYRPLDDRNDNQMVIDEMVIKGFRFHMELGPNGGCVLFSANEGKTVRFGQGESVLRAVLEAAKKAWKASK